MRGLLVTCTGFSIFAFIILVGFTWALRTHVMTLDKLPGAVRDNASSACLFAGFLYGACAVACVYYLKSDKREARELELLAKAEENLERTGTRMTKAGRKLAIRVHHDMTAQLGDPLLESSDRRHRVSSLAQYLNRGSLGRPTTAGTATT
eukprot:Protomagalhaensia_wolfi_Nauph_80__2549@NODE_2708_length_1010_cov_576_600412_g2120_i0_p1_GENE_NODE_2708_length_1010_cov_576_600412_g2120_i0NODE_2708_length_1010_cov_576_600412_g2120_i0_p1_ORF_typecomplete_len150_score7_72Tmemb_14/PF03647_13/3_4e03Tmemb_14/PF03647_13/0_17Ribophorin_II/PF05817_14/0_34FixS/PF03597_15/0_21FixS/PF03597_15/4_2e03_NODE_2708_length_1010_cov_576_600412_g2120_i0449898